MSGAVAAARAIKITTQRLAEAVAPVTRAGDMARVKRFPKLLALVAGAVSATGFAPLDLWPVTIAAFALWMWLVAEAPTRRAALARGWCFGVGHFAVGLNWIAGSFRYQDTMPVWLGWVAVVALSFYLAVYTAMAAGLVISTGAAMRDRSVLQVPQRPC